MCASSLWLKLLHLVILKLGCCDFKGSCPSDFSSLTDVWDSEAIAMAYEAETLTTSLNLFPITFL